MARSSRPLLVFLGIRSIPYLRSDPYQKVGNRRLVEISPTSMLEPKKKWIGFRTVLIVVGNTITESQHSALNAIHRAQHVKVGFCKGHMDTSPMGKLNVAK